MTLQLALLLALQEPELGEILRRMEAEARSARGTAFDVAGDDGHALARVRIAKDGDLRVDETWGFSLVLDGDGLLIFDRPGELSYGILPLRGVRERIALGQRSFITPEPDLGISLLQALAPGRLLGAEPGLRLDGRADEGGRAVWILSSRAPVSRAALLPDCAGTAEARFEHRRFFVSLDPPRLLRTATRTLWTPCWKNQLEIVHFEDWEGGIPRRIRRTSISEADEGAHDAVLQAAAVRAEDAAVLLPEQDLVARWARDPALPELLKARPRDPDVLYSAALRAALDLPEDPEEERGNAAAIRRLEEVLDVRLSEAALRGLFELLAQGTDADKARAWARRVADTPGVPPGVRADAARALLTLDEEADVTGLLPAVGFESLRIEAMLARKDFDGALALAAASPDAALDRPFWQLVDGQDAAPFRAALDRAIAKRPDSLLLRKECLAARFLAPLAELLDVAERFPGLGEDVVRRLRYRILKRRSENDHRAPAEEVAKQRDRLLAVLAAEGPDDAVAWVLRGSILRRTGDPEGAARAHAEAEKRFGPLWKFREEADLLGQELAELRDAGHFERVVRGILVHGRKTRASAWDLGEAAIVLVRRRLAAGEGGRLIDDLRGLAPQGMQYRLLGIRELEPPETEALEAAVRAEAERRPGDPDALLWLAMQIEADEEQQGSWKIDAAEIYDRVLEQRPADVAALERLAVRTRRQGRTERAVGALKALEAAYAGGAAPADRRWSPRRAALLLAEQLLKRGDRDGAAEALGRAGLDATDLRPWEIWLGAALRRGLGDAGGALVLLRRLEAEGYRPYPALAELHEEREDWLEALRALHRASTRGAEPWVPGPFDRPVGGFHGRLLLPPPAPEALAERRAEVRRKAGELYFIRRFLEGPLPALEAGPAREAAEAVARLGSEAPEQREAAEHALRKLGPGAAAALAPLIEHPDPERRARARAILSGWAEPR